MSCASVAVPVPVRRQFTYDVPSEIADRIGRGARVAVRLGPRRVRGTVVDWPVDAPDEGVALKPIEALVEQPPLPESLLALTRFVSDYYLCSWGEAIEAALPPDARAPSPAVWLARDPGSEIDALPLRAVAQRRVWERLPADGGARPRASLSPGDRRAADALVAAGRVVRSERTAPSRFPLRADAPPPPPRTPTAEQQAALDRLLPALGRGAFEPFLLFGATGSGKTEVYLRAAEETLRRGRSVLYLVPEIGLTPLLVSSLARRFPERLAVMHSGLPARERREAWEAAAADRARFVVGTRSAVFAPLADIGLIVVDEEQDASYKQDEAPRYNGRDLAAVRARSERAVLLLGSATPSMESFHNTRRGRSTLIPLGGRVANRPLARVHTVDMRETYHDAGEIRPLSQPLVDALRACIDRGEQALILRNRRGWAVALFCPKCGNRAGCDRCSISMTWHRRERRLRCHACDQESPLPAACPTCGHEELTLLGQGTERVEADLAAALPGARIERLDRDTTRRRGAQRELLERFRNGAIDVLVGTQMIAKGHDFHNVTLVGVLSADQALGLPDFRAGERTFQLLTQVAGRAGRGDRPGSVIVQAFDPEHPVIKLAAAQDYPAFFARELRYRRSLRYPPLAALVALRVLDRDESRAREWAEQLADAVRSEDSRLLLAGPGPAPVERIRDRYRQQLLVRAPGRRRLVAAIDRALRRVDGLIPARALRVDVDPLSLL